MNLFSRLALVLAVCPGIVLTVGGCNAKEGPGIAAKAATKAGDDSEAVVLLKRSMDTYAAMPAFKADCKFAMGSGGFNMPASERSVAYAQPNRFKVVSTNAMGFLQTSVSDGTSVLEFDNMTGQPPRKERAPEGIAQVASMQMKHPMFCGSLLYQFFGGSGNYAGLVDAEKGPVTFGPEEKAADGEPARVVKFYGQQQYGHVEVLIGKQTGFVYRIKYDSEPLIKQMQNPETMKAVRSASESALKSVQDPKLKNGVEAALSMPPPADGMSFMTEESYTNLDTPATLPVETFALNAPKGVKPLDLSAFAAPSTEPPMPIGSPAPDFSVTGLDGKAVRLSEFRGKPVLLDFWATWCGPCVASLPHTQELYTKGKAMGLQVLAISDEDRTTVAKFIEKNNYTFPTALDSTKEAGRAYKTVAIPTTVVIDAQGKLVAYIVGGGQDEAIQKALAKVGVKVE